MKYLIAFLIVLTQPSCKHAPTKAKIDAARQEVKQALNEKNTDSLFVTGKVVDEKSAIAAAEPLLFKVYGRDDIVEERPYDVYLVDGFWLLEGRLPSKYTVGGTFLIIFSAKDGRVIKLIHGK